MAEFLLVHGSCHGAWCWDLVIPHLAERGHSVQAIDLPSHGADTTPIAEVTLNAYADTIARACKSDCFLVGHSMGGYAIAEAAKIASDRITKLVYLCAYVPQEGLSLAQMRKLAPTQPLLPAIRTSADGMSFTVDPEKAANIFYQDCPDDLAEKAVSRLCSQAIAPTNTPFFGTAEQAALPRHYIRCMDDKAIPPEFQVTMTKDWEKTEVQEMSSGHSPFLAEPAELAERLHMIAIG